MDMLKQLSLAGLVPVIKVKHAEDAVPVDTTEIDFDASFRLLCAVIREHLGLDPKGALA